MPARAAIADGQLPRDGGKIERIERPQLDGRRGGGEPADDRVAQLARERALLAAAQCLDPAAHRRGRALRQHHALLEQIVEGVERRLAVARMRQRAGMVARLGAPAFGVDDERRQKPHQRPPFLHGAAEIVHRVLARTLRVGDRRARAGQDMAGNGAHRRADRRFRLQGRFVRHIRV